MCATAGPCDGSASAVCRPNESLDYFNNVVTPGFFTLNVCDRAAGDIGSFFWIEVEITGTSRSLDVDGNTFIEPLKDGILTLRHEFGFSGAVLIDGAVGDGCIRCTAEQIDSFLDYP